MVEMTKNPDIEWTEKDVMDEVNTIMFEVWFVVIFREEMPLLIICLFVTFESKRVKRSKTNLKSFTENLIK